MILPDHELMTAITDGSLIVRPFAIDAVRPASIDVRLGAVLKIAEYRGHRIHHLIDDGPFPLSQGTFLLAATLEWIEVGPEHIAILAGKSSLARQGLILENAGYVDPGWRGELTLEMFNLSPRPVVLSHGMWIGQLRVERLSSRCESPYGSDETSHYQDSRGPVESRTDS